MDKEKLKSIIKDIKIYRLMQNDNYRKRLKEAYDYIKSINIRDYNDFITRENLLVGAFGYDEITIFDRMRDEDYAHLLADSSFELYNMIYDINNPTLGDDLASWGKLGYTPKRDELIAKGDIVYGLTSEEQGRHYR